MLHNSKKPTLKPVYYFLAALAVLILYFTASLIKSAFAQRRLCQEIIPLSGIEYNGDFLDEAAKLPGFCSVSPVLDVPVSLKMGDYTMECTLCGVNLDELLLTVKESRAVPMGTAPVLLPGSDFLASMEDADGHLLSQAGQAAALENYRNLQINYSLPDEEGEWFPCLIAGVLSEPSDKIYIPYAQAEKMLSRPASISKILLTIRGEANMTQAKKYLRSPSR
ncbi:MAG: hypothetical protein Q4C91_15070 [Eubacteriales bacterium]|nr:hypothetical protein [Eubacteriales bacterium]